MNDETKLPKWVQEQLRELRSKLARAERDRNDAQKRAERDSGRYQEAIDTLEQCAREGNETAKTAIHNYRHGQPLRAGHTDY